MTKIYWKNIEPEKSWGLYVTEDIAGNYRKPFGTGGDGLLGTLTFDGGTLTADNEETNYYFSYFKAYVPLIAPSLKEAMKIAENKVREYIADEKVYWDNLYTAFLKKDDENNG